MRCSRRLFLLNSGLLLSTSPAVWTLALPQHYVNYWWALRKDTNLSQVWWFPWAVRIRLKQEAKHTKGEKIWDYDSFERIMEGTISQQCRKQFHKVQMNAEKKSYSTPFVLGHMCCLLTQILSGYLKSNLRVSLRI